MYVARISRADIIVSARKKNRDNNIWEENWFGVYWTSARTNERTNSRTLGGGPFFFESASIFLREYDKSRDFPNEYIKRLRFSKIKTV